MKRSDLVFGKRRPGQQLKTNFNTLMTGRRQKKLYQMACLLPYIPQKVDFLAKKFADKLHITTFVRLLQKRPRAELPDSNKPGESPAHKL